MAYSFEFAFLGQEHNYVATVTKTVKSTCPLEPSLTAFYGLPQSFQDQYSRLAKTQYIYNIRGHDFLSFMGQWTSMKNISGCLHSNSVIYGEISELQQLAREDGVNLNRKADLITSFGPYPGSFLADAFRLKRYRWANLPADLERAIQNHLCLHGYGKKDTKIHDVAMNAQGGWVMQLDNGSDFLCGGELPPELKKALEDRVRTRKATIIKLFLNHQHPTEYVLILSDGRVYIRLHADFKVPIWSLIEIWASDYKKIKANLHLNFVPSCWCSEKDQQQKDALYYSRRGTFHLRRGDVELAYKYLREAHSQDQKNHQIRNYYAIALYHLRQLRKDPRLEEYLEQHERGREHPLAAGSDHNADFRLQYVVMLRTIEDMEVSRIAIQPCVYEWSCSSPVADEFGSPIELMDSNDTYRSQRVQSNQDLVEFQEMLASLPSPERRNV